MCGTSLQTLKGYNNLKKRRSRPGSKNYVSVGRRNEKSFIRRRRDVSAKIEKVLKQTHQTSFTRFAVFRTRIMVKT